MYSIFEDGVHDRTSAVYTLERRKSHAGKILAVQKTRRLLNERIDSVSFTVCLALSILLSVRYFKGTNKLFLLLMQSQASLAGWSQMLPSRDTAFQPSSSSYLIPHSSPIVLLLSCCLHRTWFHISCPKVALSCSPIWSSRCASLLQSSH